MVEFLKKKSTTYQPDKIFGIFRDTGTGRKVKVDFHYSAKVKTFISYLANENQMTMTECSAYPWIPSECVSLAL